MKNKHVSFLLLERLERISADSIWAHQASGVRGSLLKLVQQLEIDPQAEPPEMMRLVSYGFHILEKAAREKTSSFISSKKESPKWKISWCARPGNYFITIRREFINPSDRAKPNRVSCLLLVAKDLARP